MRLDIIPIPKPRMTQSDRWKKRPAVVRYFAYADNLRLLLPKGYCLPDAVQLEFGIPMPKSWSKKKRQMMDNEPHQQRPDTDNLTKAIKDILCDDDGYVWREYAEKRWSVNGYVRIEEL